MNKSFEKEFRMKKKSFRRSPYDDHSALFSKEDYSPMKRESVEK